MSWSLEVVKIELQRGTTEIDALVHDSEVFAVHRGRGRKSHLTAATHLPTGYSFRFSTSVVELVDLCEFLHTDNGQPLRTRNTRKAADLIAASMKKRNLDFKSPFPL